MVIGKFNYLLLEIQTRNRFITNISQAIYIYIFLSEYALEIVIFQIELHQNDDLKQNRKGECKGHGLIQFVHATNAKFLIFHAELQSELFQLEKGKRTINDFKFLEHS